MRRIIPLVLTLCLNSAAGVSTALAAEIIAADGSLIVSIIQLIATPEKFHGKKVTVTGFATIEFEKNSLCFMERSLSSLDCLWLTSDDGPLPRDDNEKALHAKSVAVFETYNKKVILVRGVFDMNDRGHFGGYSGGIGQITQVIVTGR